MHFGLHAFTHGFQLYRQSSVGLAGAKKLGKNLSTGLRFNYQTLRIAGYGSLRELTADAAALFHLSSKLHFGIQLLNPAGLRRKEGNIFPSVYSVGLGYEPSTVLSLSAEIIKEHSQMVGARMGLQYRILSDVTMRISVVTSQPSLCFGALLQRGALRLELYNSYNLQLGSGIGLGVGWKMGGRSSQGKKIGSALLPAIDDR